MFEELTFPSEDRECAEEAARDLYGELLPLGVALDDIDVVPPCGDCERDDYKIRLGNMTVDDVERFAGALRKLKHSAAYAEGPPSA